jgi:hypothetical protein
VSSMTSFYFVPCIFIEKVSAPQFHYIITLQFHTFHCSIINNNYAQGTYMCANGYHLNFYFISVQSIQNMLCIL